MKSMLIKKSLSLLVALLAFSSDLKAGHIYGAEIIYRSLDSFVYEVDYIVYRDCRGTALTNINSLAKVSCSGTNTGLSLSLVSIEDVSHADTNPCNPVNTFGTGAGLEKHVYRDTIDFNSSTYSYYKSCCNVRFEFGICCRSTNIISPVNYYNFSSLNLCEANGLSAFEFVNDPIAFSCCNKPLYFNPGGLDPFNRDSISFKWASAQTGYSSYYTYTGLGISYNHPFRAYYPAGYQAPDYDPGTSQPIGIYLDHSTGDVILTPTQCDHFEYYVIEAEQWRRTDSGTFIKIGSIRRDVAMVVEFCSGKSPPRFPDSLELTTCAGLQSCFTFTIQDSIYTSADTLSLTARTSIPNADFYLTDSTARIPTGRFCWNPALTDVKSTPYLVHFEAEDNQSVIHNFSQRALKVNVLPIPEASVNISYLDCGYYRLHSIPDSTYNALTYLWEVFDSNMQPLDSTQAYFTSNFKSNSVNAIDTLKFRAYGKIIIRHTLTLSGACTRQYHDTIDIAPSFSINLEDAQSYYCMGSVFDFQIQSSFASTPIEMEWFANDSISLNHFDSSLKIHMLHLDSTYKLRLDAVDNDGCWDRIYLNIPVRGIDILELDDSVSSCAIDIELVSGNAEKDILWNTGDTTSNIFVSNSGLYYYLALDAFGCNYSDSTLVLIHSLPVILLESDTVCADSLILNPGNFESYHWNTGSMAPNIVVYSSNLYTLDVIDSNGCEQSKSVSIELLEIPDIQLRDSMAMCCNDSLDLSILLASADPTTGIWSSWVHPTKISNSYFYSNGICDSSLLSTMISYTYTDPISLCQFEDSSLISIFPAPEFSLEPNRVCLSEDIIYLNKALLSFPDSLELNHLWTCIECNGNDPADLISGNSDLGYKLLLSEYSHKNDHLDTVILQLEVLGSNGCSKSETIELYILKGPQTPILEKSGETLWVSNPSDSVRWYLNGEFLQSGTDSFIIIGFGRYEADNVDSNGCTSVLSDSILRSSSVQDLNASLPIVYPNPSDGTINIRSETPISEIHLYDLNGNEIQIQTLQYGQGFSLKIMAESGLYILELSSNAHIHRYKLIITR